MEDTEKITDKHIKVQALQHLLIHYENKHKKYKKNKREDILKVIDTYIAKIRRTIIRELEEQVENNNQPIKFY
tara:strand:+ start:337 stop:555 length:219 start_codon:yes stop_codon:yes gene_type:complete